MYKGRLKVWALVLIAALIITNFSSIKAWNETRKDRKEAKIYIDSTDPSFSDNLAIEAKFKNIKLTFSSVTDADIIVQRHSDKEIAGFEKIENKFYTPMIAVYYNDSDANLVTYSDSSIKQINLKKVLEAIERNASASEYFDNSDAAKHDLTLCIPNKSSPYYEDVVKTILVTLYDTPTTKENLDMRMERVNKIIDKSVQINDIYYDFRNGDQRYYAFLLMPEAEALGEYMAYLTDEYFVSYDLYVRSEKSELKENFLNELDTNLDIFEKTKFRVNGSTYKKERWYSAYIGFMENCQFGSKDDMILY